MKSDLRSVYLPLGCLMFLVMLVLSAILAILSGADFTFSEILESIVKWVLYFALIFIVVLIELVLFFGIIYINKTPKTRQYIALQNANKPLDLHEVANLIHIQLETLLADKKIKSYNVKILGNEDDIEELNLNVEQTLTMSKDRLPVIFVGVTCLKLDGNQSDTTLKKFKNKFHLREIVVK